MTGALPCIRHGDASIADPRLIATLERAQALGLVAPTTMLAALLDYDGQLWATWRDAPSRAAGSALLTQAWGLAGGERGALHLLRSTDDYDYQEDCMNDASA